MNVTWYCFVLKPDFFFLPICAQQKTPRKKKHKTKVSNTLFKNMFDLFVFLFVSFAYTFRFWDVKEITQKKVLNTKLKQVILCDLEFSIEIMKLLLLLLVSVYERVLVQKHRPVNYTVNKAYYYIESNIHDKIGLVLSIVKIPLWVPQISRNLCQIFGWTATF